jgi:hypothetical protein
LQRGRIFRVARIPLLVFRPELRIGGGNDLAQLKPHAFSFSFYVLQLSRSLTLIDDQGTLAFAHLPWPVLYFTLQVVYQQILHFLLLLPQKMLPYPLLTTVAGAFLQTWEPPLQLEAV